MFVNRQQQQQRDQQYTASDGPPRIEDGASLAVAGAGGYMRRALQTGKGGCRGDCVCCVWSTCVQVAGVVGLRCDSTARQNPDRVLHCATWRPCC